MPPWPPLLAPTSTRSCPWPRAAPAASSAWRRAADGCTCAGAPSAATSAAATSRPASTPPRTSGSTEHPIIQSFEPGEDWYWCYVDDLMFDIPAAAQPVASVTGTARRDRPRRRGVRAPNVRMGTATGRWVIAAAVLGSGVAFLDSTVVNAALPAIGKDFHADLADLQWVLTGLPADARLAARARRIARRPVRAQAHVRVRADRLRGRVTAACGTAPSIGDR